MARINDDDFACVIRVAPLVALDFVIHDAQGNVFVGRRRNEPAKGFYFVPGGVIRKDERMRQAFTRILAAETGLSRPMSDARFLGAFEHFYSTNRYGDPAYGTHYVVLAHELVFRERPEVRLDDQHSEFRWISCRQLLASPDVHANTKAYLRK